MSNIGIGQYRGPGVSIPDDLVPGMAPAPSAGTAGPNISTTIEGYLEHKAMIDAIAEKMALSTRPDYIAGVATAQTSADGTVDFILYQIAAGMEATIHRLSLNATNTSTNVPYSFASPYSNAAGLIEIHVTDSLNGIGFTTLVDGGPPTASGPIFPSIITDNSMQASFGRGPMMFVCRVKGGPANSSVMVRYQICLNRAKGVV